MSYIYIFIGTIFSMAFVAQMLAFAAYTKKKKVRVRK
jgi:hypothetical protein